MKKTIFYVDGFNLHHGLLKDTPYQWLDLATEMMADVMRKSADTFVVVSGDVDFAAPLCFIRHEMGLRTLVFNPHGNVCEELRRFTSYYKNIPRDLPAKCQLPETVTLANGSTIHRPPAWK